MPAQQRPIIVVTGANGGVGFGICHRLLVQLAHRNPPDASPRLFSPHPQITIPDSVGSHDVPASTGATIVMACRDRTRAERARTQLLGLLDDHIAKLDARSAEGAYAREFRANVELTVMYLDLSIMESVFNFGTEFGERYLYVSHLICNAGVAAFSHIGWGKFFKQLATKPMHTVEHPCYNIQTKGTRSKDGLGWTWQCNVFGHYVLLAPARLIPGQFRTMQPVLNAYSRAVPASARVIWMSSIHASPEYDRVDWQLMDTVLAYEASKYQNDIIALELTRRALLRTKEPVSASGNGHAVANGHANGHAVANGNDNQQTSVVEDEADGQVLHYLVEPGITPTNFAALLLDQIPFGRFFMAALFYIVRLMGSPHVLFSPYHAALAAVQVALAVPPLPSVLTPHVHDPHHAMPKYGSQTDRWGAERLGVAEAREVPKREGEGRVLLDKCEELYQEVRNGMLEGKAED
ncbi:hypothetical protein CERSUDRAFT_77130 [Gelatoporia subvermispora B]|uniref:3-keto sterol reductase n=1 Tax=Ceriporiopsis subvermispora (strain B) TaxID=914234 RepID=M2QKT4_CERS8|nr:hypothetical protein CERSUDRAFT_77130 [Gelatoporia subvermispora B]